MTRLRGFAGADGPAVAWGDVAWGDGDGADMREEAPVGRADGSEVTGAERGNHAV